MYKRTMALLIVVLMLLMGGVKVKADHCGPSRMISRTTSCEGSCMKWGVESKNYMEEVEYGRDCWSSSGKYYYDVDNFEYRKIGCC